MRESDAGRWERLFADLEDQADALERAEEAAQVGDRVRAEVGDVRLYDRLRAAVGQQLALTVRGAGAVAGALLEVGPDWLLLGEPYEREVLVPFAAVTSVGGLGRHSAAPGSQGRVAARLTLRWALRRLARDRAAVCVFLADGCQLGGTVDRVGADFVELAEHPAGEPRRASAVRGVRAVPLHALALIRRP
ncbi:hypothetical protein [Fodinicola feengrottensis]|uniref:hypothetical protein n=1 Tax=Fodinicola feengrottensis TaxID=435914 RepID=UPI0024418620|nr:hypothetical protein [Fodinicola feengrottensis]